VVFDAEHLDSSVAALVKDYRWEPVGRAVERHLNEMFVGMITSDGYVFDWSSTRIRPDHVSINTQDALAEDVHSRCPCQRHNDPKEPEHGRAVLSIRISPLQLNARKGLS
jgi:hypothetical protein